jgi:hypothetical protein
MAFMKKIFALRYRRFKCSHFPLVVSLGSRHGGRLQPNLKVLYTTGQTKSAVAQNGVLDAGVHLLSKPFTIKQFSAALKAVQEP